MVDASRTAKLSKNPWASLGWGFVFALGAICLIVPVQAQENSLHKASGSEADKACQGLTPKQCVALAIEAMGGSARLETAKSMSFETASHTLLVEQSYRQDPFIASYERSKVKVDLAGNRIRVESQLTWPESDPGQSESNSTLVGNPEGCVHRRPATAPDKPAADSPCPLSDLDWVRDVFSIGPMRLLTTAQQASDLHAAPAEILRSTSHPVLAFSLQGTQVRILVNPFNHLPDAIETVRQFHDHWYQWGDVRQRIYLDNWVTVQGIRYPTNLVEERNGVIWKSTQLLNLRFDVPLESGLFEMDAKIAAAGAQSKGWERPFQTKGGTELAPGVTFFPGAWNATLVKQDDGAVLLEAPISGTYMAGVLAEAGKQYPNVPHKGVLSTSDSWPHVGGVRQAVASKHAVYILDLNQPLLDRLVAAKHELHPDQLAQAPQRPLWKIVSGKTTIGTGDNRMELYPLRGACTERQYMVYFPAHQLLYASDTLAMNDDGSLYDPELMREVMEAVQREGLQVKTVFAMHQAPMPWSDVVALVQKAMS